MNNVESTPILYWLKELETTAKNETFKKFNKYALNIDELFVIRGGDGEVDPDPEIIIIPEL